MTSLSHETYLQLKETIKNHERTLREQPLTDQGRARIKGMVQQAKMICASYEVMEMSDKYIIQDGKVVPEPDLIKWAMWFETADRHVALDKLPGGISVSTVFLGLDHRFTRQGQEDPILWETLITGGQFNEGMARYTSVEAALHGHKVAVAKIKSELNLITEEKND